MSDARVLSAQPLEDELQTELSLRPRRLKEYIGQQKVKRNLDIAIQAARKRKEPLDHVLLFGPPGLGKTTLANILAHEMEAPLMATSAPALEKAGDIAAILMKLEKGGILFIDEIHRLQPILEEKLYSAMEDFELDVVIGQGPAATIRKIKVEPFTLVGATTRAGLLSAPLRARFGIVQRLDFYDAESLTIIVRRSAEILGIAVDEEATMEIAQRARGTPRIANRLLRRIRDLAEVKYEGKKVTTKIAREALDMLAVDEFGLDDIDRKLLTTLIERFRGGPAGLNALASSIGEDRGTIEDLYEPYLIQIGFLQRTPRGRIASKSAHDHLHLEMSGVRSQNQLF